MLHLNFYLMYIQTWEAIYIAAAATEIGDLPGTMSISTAFFAIYVAARCTIFGRSKVNVTTNRNYIYKFINKLIKYYQDWHKIWT